MIYWPLGVVVILGALLAGCVPPVVSLLGGATYKTVGDARSIDVILRDKLITWQVQTALMDDETLSTPLIETFCYEGHLFLLGWRDSLEQEQKVVAMANQVNGVRDVTVRLFETNDESMVGLSHDAMITGLVKNQFLQDEKINATFFEIKTFRNRVILLGVVQTRAQLDYALEVIRGVDGVGVEEIESLVLVKEELEKDNDAP